MIINKHIRIRGKVQGVFFRKSTWVKALQLAIKGWVKNEPDGTVLAEIEGKPEAVSRMENWFREGPEHAMVESLEIEEGHVKGYADFEIRT